MLAATCATLHSSQSVFARGENSCASLLSLSFALQTSKPPSQSDIMHRTLALGLLAPWLLASAAPANKHGCKCVWFPFFALLSIVKTHLTYTLHRHQTTNAGRNLTNGIISTPLFTASSSRRSQWLYLATLAPSKTPRNARRSTKDGLTRPSKRTTQSVSAIRSTQHAPLCLRASKLPALARLGPAHDMPSMPLALRTSLLP